MTTTAIGQGVTGAFAVRQDYGMPPEGEVYICDTVTARGTLLFLKSEGLSSQVSGNMASTATILGFVEQDVVADNSTSIQFGFSAQQQATVSGDAVTIWRFGRFFVTAVSGSVSAGGKVYPGDGGKVQGAQVGSAPAIGYCVKGNAVAGDPIEVEINLIGRQAL